MSVVLQAVISAICTNFVERLRRSDNSGDTFRSCASCECDTSHSYGSAASSGISARGARSLHDMSIGRDTTSWVRCAPSCRAWVSLLDTC